MYSMAWRNDFNVNNYDDVEDTKDAEVEENK